MSRTKKPLVKIFFNKIWTELFVALIIAIIGFIINYNKENNYSKKRFIDSYERVDYNNVDSFELKEHDMQLLYKGNDFTGFSTIDVELYNFSDRDFEKMKVLIKIKPQPGDSLQIVEAEVSGLHGQYAGITKTKDNSKKALKGNITLEYIVEPANRADSLEDRMFDASYAIISEYKPSIAVSILEKGINKRPFQRENFVEPLGFLESNIAIICYLISGFILFIIFLDKMFSFFYARRNKRWDEYLLKNFTERIDNSQVEYKAESIISAYRDISNRFDYEDASKIMRRLKRLKPPE